MKKILLIKTTSLGDVVHNLPVVNDILQHFPQAQIDWVVEESFADIPRLHASVNQVFTVAFRRWTKAIMRQNTWVEIAEVKKNIQQNQYDAIVDTQGLLKSALVTRWAKCTIHGAKHGYDKHSIREPLASWFYDTKHAISYQQHAVVRNRTLAALSLGYTPPISAPDYGILAPKSQLNLPKNYVIGLHGTSRDSKLWPTQHWVNLGQQLQAQGLSLLLPWASQAELERAKYINNQLLNGFEMPKLTISELATVIAQARAAIGVDTGLSHLAAALNIATVAIYTDTNPALTGVLAGAHAPAVNLGGVAQLPSVETVLQTLHTLAPKF